MTVTKRTRYEVLRRDNHACRYCGCTAPEVKLTVDHVTPVSLGGSDSPDNLVAACKDCNAGKSSSAPDSALVADVSEQAVRFAKLTKAAWAIRVEAIYARAEYVDEVKPSLDFSGPPDWQVSIGRFYDLGIPAEVVTDAAQKASAMYDPYGRADKFRYMCGIVWNHVKEVGNVVEQALDMDGYWYTESDICDERIDGYEHGWRAGKSAGFKQGMETPDLVTRALHHVVEGSYPWVMHTPIGTVDA